MAQGDYWQLAVGVPLINPQFTVPQRLGLTLNGNHAAAVTALNIDSISTPAIIAAIINVGDYLSIGPSTSTANPGLVESFKILSVSGNTINLEGTTVYAYLDNDPVSLIGTRWPQGWSINHAAGIANPTIVAGHRDQYAFQADYNDDGTVPVLSIGTTNSTNKDSPLPDLTPGSIYRLACMYKGTAEASSANVLQATYYNQTPTLQTHTSGSMGTSASWAEQALTFTAASTILSRTLSIIFAAPHLGTGATATGWALDNFVLSHARGTSGASSARITMPEYADFQTVSYQSRQQAEYVGAGARLYRGSSALDFGSIEKYQVQALFSNITQSFYNDLLVLLDYQRKGFPLVLWPYIDDLPHAMVGFVEIWPIQKQHWDWSERTFQLKFTEQ